MVTGGPADKPAFLDPVRAESLGYIGADEIPTFDAELEHIADPESDVSPAGKGPTPGYRERWRAIARLNALGLTSGQIGRKLGYSPAGISLALQKPWVQAEVTRYRELFEADIAARTRQAAEDGIAFIHETIHNDKAKVSERLSASQWAVEKHSGKARQEVTHESNTLTSFMQMLAEMQRRGESIDVTPVPAAREAAGELTAAPQPAKFDRWLDENL